jgi:hypothetical protein
MAKHEDNFVTFAADFEMSFSYARHLCLCSEQSHLASIFLLLFSACTLFTGFLYRSGLADLTLFTCLRLPNVPGIVTLVHLLETLSHTSKHNNNLHTIQLN